MYGLLSSEQKSAVLLHHVAVVMLTLLMSVCILVSHPLLLGFVNVPPSDMEGGKALFSCAKKV